MEIPAFAKLNLALEVLGRRDDGYHEVKTVLQTVDLADRLFLEPGTSLRVDCDDPALQGTANLVWRAAAALARSQDYTPRAHIYLQKRIPVAMGLGGGSSDAASALLGLDRLWGLGLATGELARTAREIGADVAFFLRGGTALASGRGEEILPLPPVPSLPVTLVCPASSVPNKTARLYSLLTPDHYSDGKRTLHLAEALKSGEVASAMFLNVFEEVAYRVFPELNALRQRVSLVTGKAVHLSGAGPALFCLPSSEEEHRRVSKALHPWGAQVYLVHTVTPRLGETSAG